MWYFHDLWAWMAALRTSLPFAVALPILLATAFATLADWLEHYLSHYQQTADDPRLLAHHRHNLRMAPRRAPVFQHDGDGMGKGS